MGCAHGRQGEVYSTRGLSLSRICPDGGECTQGSGSRRLSSTRRRASSGSAPGRKRLPPATRLAESAPRKGRAGSGRKPAKGRCPSSDRARTASTGESWTSACWTGGTASRQAPSVFSESSIGGPSKSHSHSHSHESGGRSESRRSSQPIHVKLRDERRCSADPQRKNSTTSDGRMGSSQKRVSNPLQGKHVDSPGSTHVATTSVSERELPGRPGSLSSPVAAHLHTPTASLTGDDKVNDERACCISKGASSRFDDAVAPDDYLLDEEAFSDEERRRSLMSPGASGRSKSRIRTQTVLMAATEQRRRSLMRSVVSLADLGGFPRMPAS
eukprot:TRINITY_DN3424_c0_g2_i1.p1 TRINITY_DN3424_c0_g2~~TRINITY_DN3424_c0_g2_i1.p1  ORF type:complete len:344 (+),score=16.78 TRINITY_DN3424_c0_g2_i1:49-1032(+)